MDPVSPSSRNLDALSAPSGSTAAKSAFESIADLCSNFEFVGIADCQTLAFKHTPISHAPPIARKEPVTIFSLPRELRDFIWDFATKDVEVFLEKKLLFRHKKMKYSSSLLPSRFSRCSPPHKSDEEVRLNAASSIAAPSLMSGTNSGLLLTAKQVRLETLPFYLRNSAFTFDSPDAALDWMKSVPRALRVASLGQIRLSAVSDRELEEHNRKNDYDGTPAYRIGRLNAKAKEKVAWARYLIFTDKVEHGPRLQLWRQRFEVVEGTSVGERAYIQMVRWEQA